MLWLFKPSIESGPTTITVGTVFREPGLGRSGFAPDIVYIEATTQEQA